MGVLFNLNKNSIWIRSNIIFSFNMCKQLNMNWVVKINMILEWTEKGRKESQHSGMNDHWLLRLLFSEVTKTVARNWCCPTTPELSNLNPSGQPFGCRSKQHAWWCWLAPPQNCGGQPLRRWPRRRASRTLSSDVYHRTGRQILV